MYPSFSVDLSSQIAVRCSNPRERIDLAGTSAVESLGRLYAEVDHHAPPTAATTAPDGAGEAALRALGYVR